MFDDHDITAGRFIIQGLCQKGVQWTRSKSQAHQQVARDVSALFIEHRSTDAVSSELFSVTNRYGAIEGPYIPLEPPNNSGNVILFLGINWDFRHEFYRLSLFLNMYGQSTIQGVRTWYRGYRLEVPHHPIKHRYTHLQPCNSTGWARMAVPFSETGQPDSYPGFPLRGDGITLLCANLAVALYGRDIVPTIEQWLRGTRFQSTVRRYLNTAI